MKRILVVDDDEDILFIVERILTDAGFQTRGTSFSEGVVQLAEKFQPELILLDYMLTDGNGGDICREFKQHGALNEVPVIMFSAYTNPNLNFDDFGCDSFIAKPFDLGNLIAEVNKYLAPALL